MRIVAVADTHTFETDLGIPEGDAFVHAGDLLRRGTLEELEDVARWLKALPHKYKIVVAGNHDWCFARERALALSLLGEEICYLEDGEISIGGLRFWGSPWQPAYGSWAFNLPRGAALAEKWAQIPIGIDVLVTHCPPHGYGDQSGIPGRHGCADLLSTVSSIRPMLHLFGHIHEAGGFWRTPHTCFANVTTWECERGPTVIDVDPQMRTVNEVSIPAARR